MALTRRTFIGSGLAAAGATACRGSSESSSNGARQLVPDDWESVRSQFELTPEVAHFAAFVLAAHPRPVAAAVARHRAGLDTDTHAYLGMHQGELDAAVPAAAAQYLGASPDEIALTDSTTMGLGLLYGGIVVRPDQHVLTTEHDFYSTHEALRLRSERTGASVEQVQLYADPATVSEDELVGRLVDAITASTRVVAVTWVHSGTGVKLPIAAMSAAMADLNRERDEADRALLCVDGVHGLGVEDVSVQELGADFLVAGTHKWLFGPRGTGIVWGRAEAWPAVQPTIPTFAGASFERYLSGSAASTLTPGAANTPGGYHSFEHRWALADAFDFQLEIGRARVAERTHSQAAQLKEGLVVLPGVRVVTPLSEELSAGIVCFELAGQAPFESLAALERQGISASVTPYRQPYLRLGPSIVTTPEEVDAAIEAVAGLR